MSPPLWAVLWLYLTTLSPTASPLPNPALFFPPVCIPLSCHGYCLVPGLPQENVSYQTGVSSSVLLSPRTQPDTQRILRELLIKEGIRDCLSQCCGYFSEAHDLAEPGFSIKILVELRMPVSLLFLTFTKGQLTVFIEYWNHWNTVFQKTEQGIVLIFTNCTTVKSHVTKKNITSPQESHSCSIPVTT